MHEDIPRGALWTPQNGWTSSLERECAKAVEEYDSALVLGQRQDTGEWVVFLKEGPANKDVFPIFGLGMQLHSAEQVKAKLHQSDVSRHGRKIYAQIVQSMAKEEAAAKKARHDADEPVAEALEWAMRKMGATPHKRIYVPSTYRPKAS